MTQTPTPISQTVKGRALRAQASEADPGPVRLSVSLTSLRGHSVVLLEGDLDVDTSVAFESAFDQLIGSGFDEVVLDVNKLRHLDEPGAVALAQLWAGLRNDGIICRVRGLPPAFADSPVELLMYVRSVDPVGNGRRKPLMIQAG
jgi:anti-anti-sigma regulatory factor